MKGVEEVNARRRHGDFVTVSRHWISNGANNRGPRSAHVTHLWRCILCGFEVAAAGYFNPVPDLDRHSATGHSACEFCGEILRNCKDGSPRRHAFNLCAGKDESYRVVSVFARDAEREEVPA